MRARAGSQSSRSMAQSFTYSNLEFDLTTLPRQMPQFCSPLKMDVWHRTGSVAHTCARIERNFTRSGGLPDCRIFTASPSPSLLPFLVAGRSRGPVWGQITPQILPLPRNMIAAGLQAYPPPPIQSLLGPCIEFRVCGFNASVPEPLGICLLNRGVASCRHLWQAR